MKQRVRVGARVKGYQEEFHVTYVESGELRELRVFRGSAEPITIEFYVDFPDGAVALSWVDPPEAQETGQ